MVEETTVSRSADGRGWDVVSEGVIIAAFTCRDAAISRHHEGAYK